ncbi:hypothetical protein [Streptomyces sp. NPDC088739]|uniref:hypothetical protein n=1 Tax=Streptomyces sp. NPDC088739 TaxID=3365882 RepID=UPI003806CFED
MNAAARTARQILRTRAASNRAQAKARRILTVAPIQGTRVHLLARGLDLDLAERFAGAVTRKAGTPAAMGKTTKKVSGRGRAVRTYDVKLFAAAQIDVALVTYRPAKDKRAQVAFLALAA